MYEKLPLPVHPFLPPDADFYVFYVFSLTFLNNVKIYFNFVKKK